MPATHNINPGQLVIWIATLAGFGVVYNAIVGYQERRHNGHDPYLPAWVGFGVLVILAVDTQVFHVRPEAVAVLLLSFCWAGIPMAIGYMMRWQDRATERDALRDANDYLELLREQLRDLGQTPRV